MFSIRNLLIFVKLSNFLSFHIYFVMETFWHYEFTKWRDSKSNLQWKFV